MCHITHKVKRIVAGQEVEVSVCESTYERQLQRAQYDNQSPEYRQLMRERKAPIPSDIWSPASSGHNHTVAGSPAGYMVMQYDRHYDDGSPDRTLDNYSRMTAADLRRQRRGK